MTPKEKGKELINKHYECLLKNDHLQSYETAKQCTLITLEEVLKVCPLDKYDNLTSELTPEDVGLHLFEEYWHEVKKEIELL